MSDDSRAITPVTGTQVLATLTAPNPRMTRGLSRIDSLPSCRVGELLQRINCLPKLYSVWGESLDVANERIVASVMTGAPEHESYWGVFDFGGRLLGKLRKITTSRDYIPSDVILAAFESDELDWLIQSLRSHRDSWIARAWRTVATEHYIVGLDDEYIEDHDQPDGALVRVDALFTIEKDFQQVYKVGTLPLANDYEVEHRFRYDGVCYGQLNDFIVALHGQSRYSLFWADQQVTYVNGDFGGPYFYPVQVGDALYTIAGERQGRLSRFNFDGQRLVRSGEWHVAYELEALAVHGDFVLALEIQSRHMHGVERQVAAYREGRCEGRVRVDHGYKGLAASNDAFGLIDFDAALDIDSIVVYRGGTTQDWATTMAGR